VCVCFLLSVEQINSDFNIHLCHGALDVRTTLLLCLSPFLICIIIILIPAYVYLNIYTHSPPLPHSYTFTAIFIFMLCVTMFYINIYIDLTIPLLISLFSDSLCISTF